MCSFSIWGRANKNPLQTKCLTFISATTQLSSHALRSPPAASCCPRPSPPCCQDCRPACQASCLLPPPPTLLLQPPAFSMPGKGTPCPDYLATFICNHLDYCSWNSIIRLRGRSILYGYVSWLRISCFYGGHRELHGSAKRTCLVQVFAQLHVVFDLGSLPNHD